MTKELFKVKLLPNYFKKVAYFIMLVAIILSVLYVTDIWIWAVEKEFVKDAIANILLLSFVLLVVTKDKDEDELTLRIRLYAGYASFYFISAFQALTFFYAVFVDVLVKNLIDERFIGSPSIRNTFYLMFFFYFSMKLYMKKTR